MYAPIRRTEAGRFRRWNRGYPGRRHSPLLAVQSAVPSKVGRVSGHAASSPRRYGCSRLNQYSFGFACGSFQYGRVVTYFSFASKRSFRNSFSVPCIFARILLAVVGPTPYTEFMESVERCMYTRYDIVHVAQTVSVRLSEESLREVDRLAERLKTDRTKEHRRIIERGLR